MTTATIVAAALTIAVYTTLATVWVRALDIVRREKPIAVVTFYFITAAIRFTAALLITAIYALLIARTHHEAVAFALFLCAVYVLTTTVATVIKH